jgi:hypothetical protein
MDIRGGGCETGFVRLDFHCENLSHTRPNNIDPILCKQKTKLPWLQYAIRTHYLTQYVCILTQLSHEKGHPADPPTLKRSSIVPGSANLLPSYDYGPNVFKSYPCDIYQSPFDLEFLPTSTLTSKNS